MVKAYLKIDTELGKERDVRKTLRKIKGVVKGESYEAISESVLGEIGMVKGIKKTTTNFVFD
ncbi:MAG: hypothetical protein CVT88_05855 [Candidatus Altiarchaeales archaeon HGW-Altiarchaeales-1]|nr:MAG: hypothetical protein CVT88_05855 [Candidatus Altiarchaeales archaeon HGW-Altiarchaeales-1]